MKRFIYFGSDLLMRVFDSLLLAGYVPEQCYVSDEQNSAEQLIKTCRHRGVAVSSGRSDPDILALYVAAGVELFVCAEYPWRVPVPKELRFGVNFHTSLLPKWAGKTPLPYILEHDGEGAGITCHQLTPELDDGPILDSMAISLNQYDDLSTMMGKIRLSVGAFAESLFANFEQKYRTATPQKDLVCAPPYPTYKRYVDFTRRADDIRKQINIFGCFGIIVLLNGQQYTVIGANASEFDHPLLPGEVINDDAWLLSLTLKDGILTLPKKGTTPL